MKAVLISLLFFYAVTYVSLAAQGTQAFIFKSMLVPAFALYALVSGQRGLFVRAWFPFLSALVLFDALRGSIYWLVELGARPIYFQYAIDLERWLVGTPVATLPLRATFESQALDRIATAIHGAHFAFFLLFGLSVWHAKRAEFQRYTMSMLGVCYLGLLCYLIIPTAPPWMAADNELVPDITRAAGSIYNAVFPAVFVAFNTNPVAAMPSLHAAFPAACACVAWRAFGPGVGVLSWAWAGLVSFSVIYLGEHYFVDVAAGIALDALAYAIAGRRGVEKPPLSAAGSLAVSAILVAAATIIGAATAP